MPSLIGRRLTVFNVVTQIRGDGLTQAMETYEISIEQAKAALNYCSKLKCQIASEKFNFCDGCKLSIQRDHKNDLQFDESKYLEILRPNGTTYVISKDDDLFKPNHISHFEGSLQELKEEIEGTETWILATDLLKKYFEK